MTRFLLIRHGTTDAIGKRLAGRMKDVHLNEEGKVQALRLAERLQGLRIDAIYSSPLERTMETAEPFAKKSNLPVITNDDFLEIDFGEWTNCSFEELRTKPGFKLFNTFRSGAIIPGGELMSQAQARIISGLQKLYIKHPNETVAIVSHADSIKCAITYYAGIHIDLFPRIEISPASVSILELYDETARIIVMNDTGKINI